MTQALVHWSLFTLSVGEQSRKAGEDGISVEGYLRSRRDGCLGFLVGYVSGAGSLSSSDRTFIASVGSFVDYSLHS